jgi:4-amino-4-deoxy-L-arabinose transferase-like glycosyltransferase
LIQVKSNGEFKIQMRKPSKTSQWFIFLLVVSTIMRAMISGLFELGNDEVYYWTYAVYPDLSHFDHPPMVGWLIRIFTLNLHFQQEFFIRLASVIGGTLNTWILFLIGKKLKDELTGWYAALLYTASIYGFVITGIFILPDTPQTLFWLLSILLMLDILPESQVSGSVHNRKMLRIGILLGLGMLSKYTTAFLWLGMVIFVVINRREWLKKWSFYAANLVMVAFFSIVLAWNARNHFVSFSYQGGRAGLSESIFNINNFLTEIGGEILYNNPVNFILVILGLVAVFSKRSLLINPQIKIILYSSLPLILIFLFLSLFRGTLPHWSGPGYMTLIPVSALWIRTKQSEKGRIFPGWIIASMSILVIIIGVSIAQITTGFIRLWPAQETNESLGKRDLSLEVFGWEQLAGKFDSIAKAHEQPGDMKPGLPIVTYRWFPAANLEYYVARPSHRYVLALGDLSEIHKYAWINQIHGGFHLNSDAWYITSSRDFKAPGIFLKRYYRKIFPPETIPIIRNGKTAYYFYVYRMKNLQTKPEDVLAGN